MTGPPLPFFLRYAAFVFRHPPLHGALLGFLPGLFPAFFVSEFLAPDVSGTPAEGALLLVGALLGMAGGAAVAAVGSLLTRRFPDRLGPSAKARRLLLRGEVGDDPEVAAHVVRLAYLMLDQQFSSILDPPLCRWVMAFWLLGSASGGFLAYDALTGGDSGGAFYCAVIALMGLLLALLTPLATYRRFQARQALAAYGQLGPRGAFGNS